MGVFLGWVEKFSPMTPSTPKLCGENMIDEHEINNEIEDLRYRVDLLETQVRTLKKKIETIFGVIGDLLQEKV